MLYPTVDIEDATRDIIDNFGGYNHNVRINENEFYDMKNMSSDAYPVLASRARRGLPPFSNALLKNTRGMLYNGSFYCLCAKDKYLYLFGDRDDTLSGGVRLNKTTNIQDSVTRQLVMIGAYLIILPDKQYINTADLEDNGKIEASFTSALGASVVVQPCDIDGTTYSIDFVGKSMPEKYWDGFVWLDTSDSPATIKRYFASNSMWNSVANNYLRVTCINIASNFKSGDGIFISGFTNSDTEKLNTNTVIKKVIDNDNIVISGLLDTVNSRNVFEVHTSKDITENYKTITVYCNEDLQENELAGKEIVVGEQSFQCVSNTAPRGAHEYTVEEDESKWLAVGSPSLLISKDVVNSNSVYVNNTYNGVEGFNFDNLSNGRMVRVGETDCYVEVTAISTLQNGVKLMLKSNVTVKEGDRIYPVNGYISDTLYTTAITVENNGRVNRGDSVSVSLADAWKQTDSITVSRKMPDMDYIVESKNRLWGCRFGRNSDGEFVNEIYASKLGDFKNWDCYEGISTDSYRASLGTDGKFTGAVSYMGYPLFFKENYIHTVYGSYPAQFQINNTACRGVEEGSEDSIAMINEVLYYKAKTGVVSYSGALPTEISYHLGAEHYRGAKACAYKNKYYMSAINEADEEVLLVYDTNVRLWHKEEALDANLICAVSNDIYYLDKENNLKSMFGTKEKTEDSVEWYVESGDLGLSYVDKKYITKLSIRLSMELGASVTVFIQYDSDGIWEQKLNIVESQLKTMTLPIRPRRCDHFRIRIEGVGNVKIYSISKTLQQGSDI